MVVVIASVALSEIKPLTKASSAGSPPAPAEESCSCFHGRSAGLACGFDHDGAQAAPESCWAIPGATASCRSQLLGQLKQVNTWGLIQFIAKSIDAGQTCANPNKKTAECVNSALDALASTKDILRDGD
jgi:hypothetical protein